MKGNLKCINAFITCRQKNQKDRKRSFFDEKFKNPQKMSRKVFFREYSTHFFFRSWFLVKKLLVVFLMWLMNWIISFEILLFRKIYIFAILIQSDFSSFWSLSFFQCHSQTPWHQFSDVVSRFRKTYLSVWAYFDCTIC